MPLLRVIDGKGEGNEAVLGDRTTLGRSRDCDLLIQDVESSRLHAEVLRRGDEYVLRDLESSNGTFVNDVAVEEHTLRHGDRIRVASVTVRFLEAGMEDSETPPVELIEVHEETVGAEAPPPAPPGYRIVEPLGRDDLGTTCLTTQEGLDRTVTLEMIHPVYCRESETVLARLRTAAGLEHPALAHVYEAGTTAEGVYVAREAAAGRALSESAGKLSPSAVAEVGAEVAAALTEAHEAGVLHGSLRPDRLVRTERGHLKLLGLGLPPPDVGTLSDEPETRSRPNRIAWMAPEQLAGETLTPAADVYSLGAVLYHLLTGRPPFAAPSEKELAAAIARESIIPIDQLRPDTPRPLAETIERMLLRHPADRVASMTDARRELERAAPGTRAPARPIRSAVTVPPGGLSASWILVVILTLLLMGALFLLGRLGGTAFLRWGTQPTSLPAGAASRGYSPPPPTPITSIPSA
jgi:hypothetical protein